MKKFLVYGICLLTVFSLSALVSGRAGATVAFTADGNITVESVTFGTGTADMLIMSGSTAESWSFASGTFTVTNPGASFKVGTSNTSVQKITATQSGNLAACEANTTPGSSGLTLPVAVGTYTIVPATGGCSDGASPAPSGSSSSSSSSAPSSYQSYNPSTGQTSTEVPKVETPKVETPKVDTAKPTTTTPPAKVATPAVPAKSSATLTKVTVSPTDGKYIGTLAELKKLASWQVWKDTTTGKLYKIEAKTIKAANAIRAKLNTLVKAVTSKPASAVALNRYLDYGSKGTDVSALQQLLKNEGVYPEGIISGNYLSATRKAVQRFQEKYNIAKKGQLGYGAVGTATRAKINALLAK